LDYLNYYPFKNKSTFFVPPDSILDSDSLKVIDFNHFIKYNYPIKYTFNSRGFRDEEWPTQFNDIIWCLGDSYTSGIGVPQKHTWPSILQHKSNKRCLNLGIHGASNPLIMEMCLQVLKKYSPKTLLIMWSFFHRRHIDPWTFVHYDDLLEETNEKVFVECFNEVNSYKDKCRIINMVIPPQKVNSSIKLKLNNDIIHNIPVLDLGRDSLHFDYQTADLIVDKVLDKLI